MKITVGSGLEIGREKGALIYQYLIYYFVTLTNQLNMCFVLMLIVKLLPSAIGHLGSVPVLRQIALALG